MPMADDSNLKPLTAAEKREVHQLVALLRIGTKMTDSDWKQLRERAQAQKVKLNREQGGAE